MTSHLLLHRISPKESPTAIARRSTRLLSLHCYILGDDPENIFSVDIPDTESVDALKKQMKEQGFNHLKHVDTWDLDLWNVCIPIDDLSYRDPPTDGPKLNPEKPLAEIFSSKLDTSCIHVVVRVPSQGQPIVDSNLSVFFLLVISFRDTTSELRLTIVWI